MKKDVLILQMDEGALNEPDLAKVKKELEEATGAVVITISKKVGRHIEIHSMRVLMGRNTGADES